MGGFVLRGWGSLAGRVVDDLVARIVAKLEAILRAGGMCLPTSPDFDKYQHLDVTFKWNSKPVPDTKFSQ
jgi:hypothetical protein